MPGSHNGQGEQTGNKVKIAAKVWHRIISEAPATGAHRGFGVPVGGSCDGEGTHHKGALHPLYFSVVITFGKREGVSACLDAKTVQSASGRDRSLWRTADRLHQL